MGSTIYKDTINKLYDSIIWTHKIQCTYLEKLDKRRKMFSILKIVFTSTSTLSTTVFALLGQNLGTMISAILVAVSLIISEVLDKVETAENIRQLKDSSLKLMNLRNNLILLSEEIKNQKLDDGMIKEKINFYGDIYNETLKNNLIIPNSVVNEATKKLKDRKDEEVNFKLL